MAGEPTITLVGNLTSDVELRFAPNGNAVANFTLACTPRTFDRQSNEWKDGETLFMRCNLWREYAENFAASTSKGQQVMVQGRLKSRSYQTKEGENRTVMEVEVDETGPTLRFGTAAMTRVQRGGGNQQGGGQQQSNQQNQQQGQQQYAPGGGQPGGQQQQQGGDPWGGNQQQQGGWGNQQGGWNGQSEI